MITETLRNHEGSGTELACRITADGIGEIVIRSTEIAGDAGRFYAFEEPGEIDWLIKQLRKIKVEADFSQAG